VYKFEQENFLNDLFQLNDTKIIFFFDEISTPYVQHYDMSLKEIDKQPIEALSSFSCGCRFVDASNDYLLFTINKDLILFNIDTKASLVIKHIFELHIINASISKDSSFLISMSRRFITIIRCCDQQVLIRCLTEHFLSNLLQCASNNFRIRCGFSSFERCLFFYHPCLRYFAAINMD
jgi:hypothetical protein